MTKRSKVAAFPYIIWIVLFTIIPLTLVFVFAFTDKSLHFTWDNLTNASKYMPVLIKSIYLAVLATVICLVIAYPLAYIMSRKNGNSQRMMVMLVMLPMWMNFLLRTYAWMTILENNGLINTFLQSIGLSKIQMINTQGAVVLGMVYNYLPFMILPLYSIMTKIDNRIIEAAQDLGAGSLHVLRRIIFPLSFPGITTGITMTFVPAVSTFVISGMLGGSNNFLIGDLIEQQFLGNEYNLNYGAATSLLLMIVVLISMGIFNQFDNAELEETLI
jgi:ABC-type spermidine/putrescine transport system, permease component I